MATTTLAKNTIAKILETTYGVAALAADPITIEWAADRALKTESKESVAKALRQINRAREHMGKMPAYPRFGTPLFGL